MNDTILLGLAGVAVLAIFLVIRGIRGGGKTDAEASDPEVETAPDGTADRTADAA